MRLIAITTMALMLAAGAEAHSNVQNHGRVVVCIEKPGQPVDPSFLPLARHTASAAFAEIGVTLEWVQGLENCPEQGIQVSMSARTPETLKPGALAYAQPYEGTHICLFLDRVINMPFGAHVGVILGYVLTHEITHILQGISRHSATGVMKAHWKVGDYADMTLRRLKFEQKDLGLIYDGLAHRSTQLTLAMNTPRGRAQE